MVLISYRHFTGIDMKVYYHAMFDRKTLDSIQKRKFFTEQRKLKIVKFCKLQKIGKSKKCLVLGIFS